MITIQPLEDATRLRPEPNTGKPYLSLWNRNAVVQGESIWTADADVPDLKQRIGDQWLKVTSINGMMVTGWMAIIHNGLQICQIVTDPGPIPPPAEDVVIDVDIRVAGATVASVKINGEPYEKL